MSGFMEIHVDGDPVLLNVNTFLSVHAEKTGKARIYTVDCDENEFYVADETYDEIKKKIRGCLLWG